MHFVGDTHDTALRLPDGLGVSVQFAPFHTSAKGPNSSPPVAVQALGVGQLTESRTDEPEGLGVRTMLHVLPLHDSAKVTSEREVPFVPTAIHASAEAQETAESWLPPKESTRSGDGGGIGAGTIAQPPFQRSTRTAEATLPCRRYW